MNSTKCIVSSISVLGLLAITSLFGCSSGVSLTEFESLQADYDGVCVELEDALEDLVNAESALATKQAALTTTQATLATTQTTLATVQTSLTETETTLATTQTALTDAQSDAAYWEGLYDTSHGSYQDITDWYNELRDDIHEKFGQEEDKQLFITPEDESVDDLVIDVTGGYSEDVNEQWADFRRMYDWVVNNIEYNSDSSVPYMPSLGGELSWHQEYWRLPSETIEDEVGDCEDMALLLVSMLRNYDSEATANWCITWDSDESGHAAVVLPVAGNQLTILDPAGNYYTGTPGSLSSDPIQDAVDDWLAHWSPEPGIYVDGIFSNYFYEEFTSTAEFVTWVNDWFDS